MRIFRILPAMFVLLLLATSAIAATLALDKDRLVIMQNDKKIALPDDMGKLAKVDNSNMRYVGFDTDDDTVKKLGITPGLYWVDKNSAIIRFTGALPQKTRGDWDEGMKAEEFARAISGASLSPKGDSIALLLGGSTISVVFFTWPDMKHINAGPIDCWPSETAVFHWYDNGKVAFDEIDLNTKRKGQYDPCGNVSVKALDLATGKISTVKQGTDLCDYHLLATKDGKGQIAKVCLKSVAAWKHHPGMKNAVKEWIPLP